MEVDSPVKEEFLVGLQCQADLLGKGCACRVVRRDRKSYVDSVPLEREDDASYLDKGRLFDVRVAENIIDAGCQGLLLISLNEKLSIRSSRTVGSSGMSSSSERSARRYSAHATSTRRARVVTAMCPSRAECRAPEWTWRTSMETYMVASAAHSLYIGKVSSMGRGEA